MRRLSFGQIVILALIVGAIVCVVTRHPNSAETFGFCAVIALFAGFARTDDEEE